MKSAMNSELDKQYDARLFFFIYFIFFKNYENENTKIYRHEDVKSTINFILPNDARVNSNFVLTISFKKQSFKFNLSL